MSLKIVADNAVEKMDIERTFGTLNYLDSVLIHKWEDYVDDNGEEKRRETDEVEHVDVRLYSSAVNGDITVTVPAEASVALMTSERNYNEEVVLVNPTARFWSNREQVNGRTMLVSGVKVRATDVVSKHKANNPSKPEHKDNKEHKDHKQ